MKLHRVKAYSPTLGNVTESFTSSNEASKYIAVLRAVRQVNLKNGEGHKWPQTAAIGPGCVSLD